MTVLCVQCGREFESHTRLRRKKYWQTDTEEEPEEVASDDLCPDCKANGGDAEDLEI